MAWIIKTYFVISSTPVVVEDTLYASTTVYQPGAVFEARENNPSITQLLADELIAESVGTDPTEGFSIVVGPTGPIGPGSLNALDDVLLLGNTTGPTDIIITSGQKVTGGRLTLGASTAATLDGDLSAGNGVNDLAWNAATSILSTSGTIDGLAGLSTANTNAGTDAQAELSASSAAGASVRMVAYGSGYTTQAGFGNTAGLEASVVATSLRLRTLGAASIELWTSGTHRWSVDATGGLVTTADDLHDIGSVGAARPRTLFLSRSLDLGTTGGATALGDVKASDGVNELFWDASEGLLTIPNLHVSGTTTVVNTEIQTADNYMLFNSEYVGNTPQKSGLVFNVDPAATNFSIASIAANVITVASGNPGAVLAAADFILVHNPATLSNAGIYEVLSANATSVTIDTTPVESFSNASMTNDATAQGTVVGVGLSIWESSTTGSFQGGFGTAAPITRGGTAGAFDFLNIGAATDAVSTGDLAAGTTASGGLFYDASTTILTVGSTVTVGGNSISVGAAGAGSLTVPGAGGSAEQFGSSAAASGPRSTAVGSATNASNDDTVAVGNGAIASGVSGTAVGKGATASGSSSSAAYGFGSTASGANSTAIGNTAGASADNSLAVGTSATANTTTTESQITAIGALAVASGNRSTAVGANAAASNTDTVAVGEGTTASGSSVVAVGRGASATGDFGVAYGFSAASSALNATAFGRQSTASQLNSVAIGPISTASADSAIAMGPSAVASTTAGNIAIGANAAAAGGSSGCISIGQSANAGNDSVVIGGNPTATGIETTAIGMGVNAAAASTAIGASANAPANCIAIGASATAVGFTDSIVIGRSSVATANNQLVIGGAAGTVLTSAFLGRGVTSATTTPMLLSTTGGSGTDSAAGAFQIAGGRSTGDATAGILELQTGTPGVPGTSAQTLATRLTLSDTDATFTLPVTAPSISKISNGTPITGTTTADPGERMIYDAGSGPFQLNAPASPVMGTRWGIKNLSNSVTAITVSGNGSNIEDPLVSFVLAATFSLAGDGISVEWEYDGTQWVVI